MVTATFQFDAELNDFLARDRRGRAFATACARAATVKHMIEALGVPHTEVGLVRVNGVTANFDYLLQDQDHVLVYPQSEAGNSEAGLPPAEAPRFIADAHLGGLARLLRMAGFDTLYDNRFEDARIEAIAPEDQRIVLTRDRELLKRRTITQGCYVRALKPEAQLRELVGRLGLAANMRPFTLCLECNAPLRLVDKEAVAGSVPPKVAALYQHFSTCDVCRRVFWEGSHWQRMRRVLDQAAGMPAPQNDESLSAVPPGS